MEKFPSTTVSSPLMGEDEGEGGKGALITLPCKGGESGTDPPLVEETFYCLHITQ